MRTIHHLLFLLSAVTVPAAAQAASPLTAAACEYRDAARHFERAVHEVRFVEHYDRRLVGRLENAACDLHSASQSNRLDRILYAWDEVQSLHSRTDAAIFHRDCYPRHPVLLQCWDRLQCAMTTLAKEIQCVRTDPVGHGYRPAVSCASGVNFPSGLPSPPLPGTHSPYARVPDIHSQHSPSPSVRLPNQFAPGRPAVGNPFPQISRPELHRAVTNEVGPFSQRPIDPFTVGRRYTTHAAGGDLRSAMIGAMLSRLLD